MFRPPMGFRGNFDSSWMMMLRARAGRPGSTVMKSGCSSFSPVWFSSRAASVCCSFTHHKRNPSAASSVQLAPIEVVHRSMSPCRICPSSASAGFAGLIHIKTARDDRGRYYWRQRPSTGAGNFDRTEFSLDSGLTAKGESFSPCHHSCTSARTRASAFRAIRPSRHPMTMPTDTRL